MVMACSYRAVAGGSGLCDEVDGDGRTAVGVAAGIEDIR